MNDAEFARRSRRLLWAWLALLLLLAVTLGAAYVRMGAWNPIAGVGIAALKTALVGALFMAFAKASRVARVAAVAGLFAWGLLLGLGALDYATRETEPAAVQAPQQLEPLRGGAVPR